MKEQQLFEWLKSEHYPDLERSPHQCDGFDCMTATYKLFIELKSRNKHYDTLLLEKKKYDYLIEEAAKLEYTPYYINYTPEGIWYWNLNDLSGIVWEEKWLPVTTEFQNQNKKMKLVTFLHTEQGIKVK